MTTTRVDALAATVARTRAGLAEAAPDLVDSFLDAVPGATDIVSRRLLGAMYREDIAGTRADWRWPVVRHGFDRVELTGPVDVAANRLLACVGGTGPLEWELADATANLALALARRERVAVSVRALGAPDTLELAAGMPADEQAVFFERLATEGHNLHPCGRTRLGWSTTDCLAHDLESGRTEVGFVAVRRDLHLGDDVGAVLGVEHPGYVTQPVHAWQLSTVVRERYADLIASAALIPLDVTLGAAPTAALRTVLLDGQPRYLKLSLDILVTSTRRTISVASTRNGPAISALLERLFADEPRLVLLPELAGAAMTGSRDLAAIVRGGLSGRLEPGEVAVPAGALAAASPVTRQTVLGEVVARYAGTRGYSDRTVAALAFLDEYARLLLPPLLRLATGYGIGFEAHLQNCVPTFVDGVPHRLVLRDLAGLRILLPRLAARGARLDLWPGSVVGTGDPDVMRAKLGYTALQAHLGEIVVRLVDGYRLSEVDAWRSVRAVVDEVYAGLRADPRLAADARDDHAFLTAPTVPHKALVRMRLAGAVDMYVPVSNPLA
jgi:siderophore synthetase component